MSFPPARRIELPEVTLSVHEMGTGPAVILCHGFPELAYSWRHQIQALAEAGFRVIAPNQRGYADSDSPPEIEAFDLVHLTDDMTALLDALDIERAVFAGHDWGGFVSWAMPVLHPDRCLGAIGVNTPYVGFPTTQVLSSVFPDPEKLYILWFQEPGVAEAVLDANVRMVFEKLMRRGTAPSPGGLIGMTDANPFKQIRNIDPPGESFLREDEITLYQSAFERSGFRGPINWYRNIDRNHELVPEMGQKKLELPCLQVTAAWDAALPPSMAAGMPLVCSDLEMVSIEECGHWTQQEKPEELSRAMIDWLTPRFAR